MTHWQASELGTLRLMTSTGKTYRRYTNLAAAIHMLQTKQITLLSPEKWDDGNDRHFMEVYQKRRKLDTLLAICLAQDSDTYGHWRVFSPNVDGVCVVLQKDLLISSFDGTPGIRHREVDYKEIARLDGTLPKTANLPFMKRWPYKPEGEYRIIYESNAEKVVAKNFPLPPGCITQVILSPWMPEDWWARSFRPSGLSMAAPTFPCSRVHSSRTGNGRNTRTGLSTRPRRPVQTACLQGATHGGVRKSILVVPAGEKVDMRAEPVVRRVARAFLCRENPSVFDLHEPAVVLAAP